MSLTYRLSSANFDDSHDGQVYEINPMGHTKPEDIQDLEKELTAIRAFENLKEKSHGVFYYKSLPFLHFHDKDGRRWADVKIGKSWKSLDIDFKPSIKAKTDFLKSVKQAHLDLFSKKGKK